MATLSERFVLHVQDVVPGYRLVKKEDSRLMRFLAIILFFNKEFMSRYTTTVYKTVYMPEEKIRKSGTSIVVTLAHEAQHVWDMTRHPLLFLPWAIGYVFPQILGILSFLAILAIWFSNWWLLSLVSLVFVAPFPAPIRMWIERRGYLMTIACCEWAWNNGDRTIKKVVDQFVGWGYYKMWPFKKSTTQWFERELVKVKEGKYHSPVYDAVLKFLKEENLHTP